MNNVINQLVAFAKIQSAIQNEINFPDGCNLRDAIKTDLFNWFQDNVKEIIEMESQKNIIGLTPNEVSIGLEYGKIECVKEYRNRTGKSLLDCKRDIEKHFEMNYLTFGTYKPRF